MIARFEPNASTRAGKLFDSATVRGAGSRGWRTHSRASPSRLKSPQVPCWVWPPRRAREYAGAGPQNLPVCRLCVSTPVARSRPAVRLQTIWPLEISSPALARSPPRRLPAGPPANLHPKWQRGKCRPHINHPNAGNHASCHHVSCGGTCRTRRRLREPVRYRPADLRFALDI
jgi:hypothetical protein